MKKLTTWIVIAVILLIGLAAVFLLLHNNSKNHQKQQSSTAKIEANQPKPVYATAGQLTPNFPTALLLGAKQTTQSSFSVSYPSATQSTAVFESTDSKITVYNDYLAYFKKNKYEILNQQAAGQTFNIYAIKTGGDVSVQITQNGKLTKVTVSLLKK
jgi:flagellar basal body-associated protein FliL